MGRSIYPTDKEVQALIDASVEWCGIVGYGNQESCDQVEEKLKNGLGSALKKLYKGRNGEQIYRHY